MACGLLTFTTKVIETMETQAACAGVQSLGAQETVSCEEAVLEMASRFVGPSTNDYYLRRFAAEKLRKSVIIA